MSTSTVSIALVGIGGYGRTYVNALLNNPVDPDIKLVAAIDPNAQHAPDLTVLQERGVPIYAHLQQFYAQSHADLVVISAPIHLHMPLCCQALAHGSSVLCEKPLAATVVESQQILAAEAGSRGFVAIGYQWSFSDSIQQLKRDILAARFGAARQLKTLVLWPRRRSYYQRSSWAGAMTAADGTWILDSPANNACAHYLHNMFYLLGSEPEQSALPTTVQAELYRANPISNYDTAALRATTAAGAEIIFIATHAVPINIGPVIDYQFEHARIRYDSASKRMVAHFADGQFQDYGSPDAGITNKLWQCVSAVRAGASEAPCCGVKASSAQTLCINAAQQSATIRDFPPQLIATENFAGDDQLRWVQHLNDILVQCYSAALLPSELNSVAWAEAGARIDVSSLNAPAVPELG